MSQELCLGLLAHHTSGLEQLGVIEMDQDELLAVNGNDADLLGVLESGYCVIARTEGSYYIAISIILPEVAKIRHHVLHVNPYRLQGSGIAEAVSMAILCHWDFSSFLKAVQSGYFIDMKQWAKGQ